MNRTGLALATLTALLLTSLLSAQPEGWGTIKGQVVWPAGTEVPKRTPIAAINQNADAGHCLSKGAVLDEEWVVNPKNRGIRWIFVWLANEDPKNKAPLPISPKLKELKDTKVVIDQPICQFIPHAIAMRQGQVLVAKNSAPIPHNFKWTGNQLVPGNAGGNQLMPPGSELPIKDLKADRLPIQIECNIHPWMKGWVRVFDHPYFAVTDEDGNFEFKDAPAGKYRLMVWGSQGYLGGAAGKNGQPIEIKADGSTDLGKLEWKGAK